MTVKKSVLTATALSAAIGLFSTGRSSANYPDCER
jgi:hypothetical protein